MATFEFEGSDIERCVRCGGTWLDSGELELLGTGERGSLDRMSAVLAAASELRPTPLRCPRCWRRLGEISVGSDPPLTLDRCRRGHGIWFDWGEMLGLIRSFGGDALNPAAQFFADLYSNEAGQTERGGG